MLDKNTCDACRAEDGTEYDNLAEAAAAYPQGGFVHCAGFARCRGTVMAVWNAGRVAAAFDPDQPRDREGQWTDTGGGGGRLQGAGVHAALGTPDLTASQGKALDRYQAVLYHQLNAYLRTNDVHAADDEMGSPRPGGQLDLTTVNDMSYLAPTAANLAKVQISIPADFTRESLP